MKEHLPKVIKKRDGKVAAFDVTKIKNAIFTMSHSTLGGVKPNGD